MNSNKKDQTVDSNYDILIVGGGPAGISTWLHLHKYAPELASRTVLIEKEKFPRDKVCGGGLGAWSPMVLKHLGVNLDIPSLEISDVEFIYGKEKFTLYQPNQFNMIQRIDFDHALAKIAVNRGLRLIENEAFADITHRNKTLQVETDRCKYNVKVLVGSDGSLSRVRRKMKLSNKPHLAPTLEVFTQVDPKFDSEFDEKKISIDLTTINDGLQGYVWHCPSIKKNTALMCHGMADFRIFRDRQLADMKSIFSSILQSRNKNIEQKKWLSHPIHWFSNEDTISQHNIILAGDAVGIEPAFGGGIHFALSYGSIAANAIIDAFKTDDFSFRNYKQRIQSHLVGKWIAKCTKVANGIYSGKMNPLKGAREVFTIEQGK